MDFFGAAAQVLPVLYLAVIFQTFGAGNGAFRSGLSLYPPKRWPAVALVGGVQVAAIGGEALALAALAKPFVAAALAALGLVLVVPQLLWAARVANDEWIRSHSEEVLYLAFAAPWVGAVIAAGGTSL